MTKTGEGVQAVQIVQTVREVQGNYKKYLDEYRNYFGK
jgi:predicted RNA-binding protein